MVKNSGLAYHFSEKGLKVIDFVNNSVKNDSIGFFFCDYKSLENPVFPKFADRVALLTKLLVLNCF